MSHHVTHFCAREIPEFLSHGLSVGPLSNESQNSGAFLCQDRKITSRVSYNLHRLRLLGVRSAAIKEGWLDVMDQKHNPVLFKLDPISQLSLQHTVIFVAHFDSTSN